MTKSIVKYETLYRIVFRDEETPDKLITKTIFNEIKQDILKNKWIELWWELYNPYLIKKIVKYKISKWINVRLSKEKEEIQHKVREYMRWYYKEITLWVVENMIKKAKWELE